MKKSIKLALMALAVFSFVSCSKKADKVVIGNIYTADSANKIVEAVAINGGKICFAGSKKDVQHYIGSKTEVTTLAEGQFAMPGFEDGHNHIGGSLFALAYACSISSGSTPAEYAALVKKYADEHPELEKIMAKGWINSAFPNGTPTAEMLDGVTDKPVYILSEDGHSLWTNKAMLQLAEITKDTPDPVGGRIDRDAEGNPVGCFRDTAMDQVKRAAGSPKKEVYAKGIMMAQKMWSALGYTQYLDVMVNEQSNPMVINELEAYEELDKAGKLLIYTQGGITVNNADDAMDVVDMAIEQAKRTKGGMFEITNIKIFMDGVIEGATAYLSEEYAHRPGYFGSCRWVSEKDIDLLSKIIEKSNKAGLSVHFHSIGDKAVNLAVEAVERASKNIGVETVKANRNAVTHLQIVNTSDMERMNKLGMVAVINPWGCKYEGFFHETEEVYLGKDRAAHEYPIKRFINNGILCSHATDFSAGATYNPIEGIHIDTARVTRDNNPDNVLGIEEAVSVEEALEMMTKNTAFQLRRENKFGQLKKGMDASLVIIDRNLLETAPQDTIDTHVLKTMSMGNWVFDRDTNEYNGDMPLMDLITILKK